MIGVTDDFNIIAPLWQETFGDSIEDIRFFCDNCADKICIADMGNGKARSMMYLVDCVCGGKAKYIYAACTSTAYRSQGLMTSLLEYARNNYGRLCLIPASGSLVDFYSSRGFDIKTDIENIKFNQSSEIINGFLFDGYNLEKPTALLCDNKNRRV